MVSGGIGSRRSMRGVAADPESGFGRNDCNSGVITWFSSDSSSLTYHYMSLVLCQPLPQQCAAVTSSPLCRFLARWRSYTKNARQLCPFSPVGLGSWSPHIREAASYKFLFKGSK